MATANTKLFSRQEFDAWCQSHGQDDFRYELDRGEIVEMPPAGELQGVVCGIITFLLWQLALKTKVGYVASNDSGLYLSN